MILPFFLNHLNVSRTDSVRSGDDCPYNFVRSYDLGGAWDPWTCYRLRDMLIL